MAAASRIPRWRKWTGTTLFLLHLILPVIALVVVPIFGFPEGVNAVLLGLSVVGGPDVLLIAAIAMLGKDGVAELMSRFGSVVKRLTKWDAVTRTRYTVGLWIAGIAMVVPTVILFFWHDSIGDIGDIGGAPGWGFWVLLASTFAFIGALKPSSPGTPPSSSRRTTDQRHVWAPNLPPGFRSSPAARRLWPQVEAWRCGAGRVRRSRRAAPPRGRYVADPLDT